MMRAVYRKTNGKNSLSYLLDHKGHGLHRVWNEAGTLLSEFPLCQDLYHGIMRQWHFNGRLYAECYYDHGVPKGLERTYNGNGSLMREVLWVNGQKHGVQRTWNLLGQIYSETSFHHGVMHGRAQFYGSDGEQVGPNAYYCMGKARDRGNEGYALLGKEAVPVPGPIYGRGGIEQVSLKMPDAVLSDDGSTFSVEVHEIPRPTSYDMALGALAADKVKRWHAEGVGPEEIRLRLLETKVGNFSFCRWADHV